MLISILFSVLSVTFSVSSSKAVEVTNGIPPANATASYFRSGSTGHKGQMVKDVYTSFVLSGWDGCIIDSIVLSMHSNSTSGAGSLCAKIGNRLVWQIEDTDFANVAWNGAFTNNWVDISSQIGEEVGTDEEVEVFIQASKNSLYINSYTIYYSSPIPKSLSVCLNDGLGGEKVILSEESIGSGIKLPNGVDTLGWYFKGWSEREIEEAHYAPSILLAGDIYYPKRDCMLWAVYSNSQGLWQTQEYKSGEYVVASSKWNVAMIGCVDGEGVASVPVTIKKQEGQGYELTSGLDDNMVYYIDFKEDSTLIMTHMASGEVIGFAETHLSNNLSMWKYRVLPDSSLCLYFDYSKSSGVLFFGYGKNADADDMIAYVALLDLTLIQSNAMRLFPAHKIIFTSWPMGKLDAIIDVPNGIINSYETIINFGEYLLSIKEGKKYLIRRK